MEEGNTEEGDTEAGDTEAGGIRAQKKPDGRTRMVRSVRNSFRQGLPVYLPSSCFTSAATVAPL